MQSTLPANRSAAPAVLAALGIAWAGCQHTINPYNDELAGLSDVTTASVEGARSAPSKPTLQPRGNRPVIVAPQDGTVAHWPLWWEDPFEDKGSNDGLFAWTYEDYFCFGYGAGRFLLNTMAFPISAERTKFFTVMCSDGELSRQALGYDHDAIPCPGGTAPPIDILEIGTFHDEQPAADEAAAPEAEAA